MGLDFSHGNAHWSYGGFSRFREALAIHEGFFLNDMQGFDGERPWSAVTTDIKPLLDHSDCDGELTPEECAQVAPRLREILADWQERGHDTYDIHAGLELADAMDDCAKSGEILEFC